MIATSMRRKMTLAWPDSPRASTQNRPLPNSSAGGSITSPATGCASPPGRRTRSSKQLHERVGNPETPEGLALLQERSPVHAADQITKPLLIAQGANDPRVKRAESDQIVAAMQTAGIPVTYVLYPDEGHGFANPANSIAFTAIAENFLATCLGGRAEPIGMTIAASTAEIVEGASFVPGLSDALSTGRRR